MCHSYKPILFIGLNNLSGYEAFISSKQSVLSFMLVFMFKFPRDCRIAGLRIRELSFRSKLRLEQSQP